MVKPITTNAAAQAAANYGHEPILILKIDWGFGIKYYADKPLTTPLLAEGRLLEVSSIASQKKQDNVGMVSVVRIMLDDFDGALKDIIDTTAIEYKSVELYQHFEGLSTLDLTLLFKGNIAGPIEWSEAERTLRFEIETKLRDLDVGFSAELGSVARLNPNAIDKAWPLCFGNVVHVPALKLLTSPVGHLKFPFRGPRSDGTVADTENPYADDTHFYLLNDEGLNFPGGTIQVSIDGVIFSGSLTGDAFTVFEANLPRYTNIAFGPRVAGDLDSDLPEVAWIAQDISLINCYVYIRDAGNNTCYLRVVRQERNKIWFDQKALPTPQELSITQLGGLSFKRFGVGDFIAEVAKNGRPGWGISEQSTAITEMGLAGPSVNGTGYNSRLQVVQAIARVPWNFQVGTEVLVWSPTKKDVYVANLIPSDSVVAVYARKRDKFGAETLAPIPTFYYTVSLEDSVTIANHGLTTITTPTTITFDLPLRYYENQGWSDEIYVTLRSSEGPNTSDIIKYLYDTYSSIATDSASFAAVATLLENYPSNFALFDKQNVITLCDEIAWQARCGILTDNGTVYLRYLSPEPSADADYDESNLVEKTLQLTFSRTEDIVTYFRAKYLLTYYPERRYQKEINTSENVETYGFHKKEFDFFIYNIKSLVQKSVDFWAHRYANSWRLVEFKTALEGIKLEIFDCVTLGLADTTLLNISSIKSIVESTDLDTVEDEMKLTLWLPSLAGSTTVDSDAWLDDSGDTDPGDPTGAYLALARDLQEADLESQLKVFRAVSGLVNPAIVIDELDTAAAGEPNAADVDLSATPYNVTVYGNGYNAPATQKVVTATPIDPTVVLQPEQKVAVAASNGKYFILTPPNTATAPKIYQITANLGEGNYSAQEYDVPYGLPIGEEVNNLYEYNGSPNVDEEWWTQGTQYGDYIYFHAPLGVC